MFKKYRQKRKIQDEIIKKLITNLEETNNWIKESRINYKYKDTDLIIQWGEVGGYDSVATYRQICSPDYMNIPRRHRKQIKALLIKIDNRDNHSNTLSFLNNYLNNEFVCKLEFNTDKKSEMSIWLQEGGIFDYYIRGKIIWFKNEEDAMAFKLRWT